MDLEQIKKVAVIGSGVMGSGIAAHLANAGCEVVLLDIVPKEATDRSVIAKGAIQKLLKTNPAPLMHKRNAKRIIPGNIEDDLEMLKQNGQIAFKYTASPAFGPVNPNGATDDIAGILSANGRVLGMMPHPERAIGDGHPSSDGKLLLRAILQGVA